MMPYDRKLGKMIWTREDKIRAVVYLVLMSIPLILMSFVFGSKTQEAIDLGIITESELRGVLDGWVMNIIIVAIGIIAFTILINVYFSWKDKKNPTKG